MKPHNAFALKITAQYAIIWTLVTAMYVSFGLSKQPLLHVLVVASIFIPILLVAFLIARFTHKRMHERRQKSKALFDEMLKLREQSLPEEKRSPPDASFEERHKRFKEREKQEFKEINDLLQRIRDK